MGGGKQQARLMRIPAINSGKRKPLNRSVVVEMGQSNMEGRFGSSPLHTIRTGYGFFWDGSSIVHLLNNRGNATGGSHATYFAERLFQLSGIRPLMVEAAAGGAGLTQTSQANNNWSAVGDRRASCISLTNNALAAVEEDAPLCGLWCQGERDAQEMDSNGSYGYADVKAAMESYVAWWHDTYPDSPLFISELGDFSSQSNTQGWQDMRQIQAEVVADNDFVFMAFTGAKDFGGNGKMGDSLHYNAIGLREMGRAFAESVAENIDWK